MRNPLESLRRFLSLALVLSAVVAPPGCRSSPKSPATAAPSVAMPSSPLHEPKPSPRRSEPPAAPSAAQPATPTLVAEGFAVLGLDRTKAREAAIANALHHAVEQRFGLTLQGTRDSENYVLTKYRIRTETRGAIESYDVLEEGAQDGIYRVKLSVRFREDAALAAGLDTVRLALVVSESFDEGGRSCPASDVTSAVKGALTESGLRLSWVDTGLTVGSASDEVREAARKNRLDLVIRIAARAVEKDRLGELILFKAEADLEVLRPASEEVLISRHCAADGARKTSASDAARSALAALKEQVTEPLLADLVRKSRGLVEVEVSIAGVKPGRDTTVIQEGLMTKEGVRRVELIEAHDSGAQFRVGIDGKSRDRLASYITDLRGARLQVKARGPGWIWAAR
ncbi:MAG: hypothetical protein HYY93_06055 [Planctomycetes bacterium]|nr:hypothetical protein [Planctomycetota bacterium]